MRSRATIKWVGLALAGLLIAAGVAIAASSLASRQIGLASEPISAGDALAPAGSPNRGHGSVGSGHGHGGDQPAPTTTTTPTPEPEPTAPTAPTPVPSSPPPGSGDDHGGGGHADD